MFSAFDSGYLNLGVGLSVTDLLLLVLFGFVLEDVDLGTFAVFQDIACNASALNCGSADFETVLGG